MAGLQPPLRLSTVQAQERRMRSVTWAELKLHLSNIPAGSANRTCCHSTCLSPRQPSTTCFIRVHLFRSSIVAPSPNTATNSIYHYCATKFALTSSAFQRSETNRMV